MDPMMHGSVAGKAYEAAIYEDWEELKNYYTQENYPTLGFPMTVNRDNPIHMAVYSKRKQPLQHLLEIAEKGGDTLPARIVQRPNALGNTPLHKAAYIGNYEAAKLLVQKKRDLLQLKNYVGETALFKAAVYGHTKVMKFLASQPGQMTRDGKLADIHRHRKISTGEAGASILHITIQGEHFGTALALLELDITLAEDYDRCGMSSLQHVANIPHAFRSGYKTGFWKSILYLCLPVFDDASDDDFESIIDDHGKKSAETQKQPQDLESAFPAHGDEIFIDNDDRRKVLKMTSLLKFLIRVRPNISKVWRQKRQHKFAFELARRLIERDNSWEQSFTQESSIGFRGIDERRADDREKPEVKSTSDYKQDKQEPPESSGQPTSQGQRLTQKSSIYFKGIDEQGGENQTKLEQEKGESKPLESSGQPTGGQGQREIALLTATRRGIIEIVNEILRVHPQAVEHCSHMQQNIMHVAVLHRQKEIFDKVKKMRIPMTSLVEGIDKNGYTLLHCAADKTFYPEGTRPGPAYQLQDELYWFKRVQKIVPPHFRNHHDKDNRTAKQLFKEQHDSQLKEAQRWIKETAQSCSAVAVLVSTVVFAAAYTVPGGSNARGLPNFLDSPIFLFFTIMDVVSLTESLIAVVMFLSILSSPSEMEDFYESLPRKLTFGFTMLFMSVTTTMLAFTATILLIIRLQPRQWTSTLVYTAAFIPVGILALTQFPLYVAFIDTLMKIFKAIRRVLPFRRVRHQFA